MSAKHTPPPWYKAVILNADDEWTYDICASRDGRTTLIAECGRVGIAEAEANADLIVRAVNSHERLLAACRSVLAAIERGQLVLHQPNPIDENMNHMRQLRDAIAAAQESNEGAKHVHV